MTQGKTFCKTAFLCPMPLSLMTPDRCISSNGLLHFVQNFKMQCLAEHFSQISTGWENRFPKGILKLSVYGLLVGRFFLNFARVMFSHMSVHLWNMTPNNDSYGIILQNAIFRLIGGLLHWSTRQNDCNLTQFPLNVTWHLWDDSFLSLERSHSTWIDIFSYIRVITYTKAWNGPS